jgi:hypothetical protein
MPEGPEKMVRLPDLVDEFAEEGDYIENAERFLNLGRWTGDDPILRLADATETTTGQNYFHQVKPRVIAFRERFLESERVDSMRSLSELDSEDEELVQVFGATRKRRVLIEGAGVFVALAGNSDLERYNGGLGTQTPSTTSRTPSKVSAGSACGLSSTFG